MENNSENFQLVPDNFQEISDLANPQFEIKNENEITRYAAVIKEWMLLYVSIFQDKVDRGQSIPDDQNKLLGFARDSYLLPDKKLFELFYHNEDNMRQLLLMLAITCHYKYGEGISIIKSIVDDSLNFN